MYRLDQRSHLEVHVTRGAHLPVVESRHIVDVAIVDAKGVLVKTFGDVNSLVFPRSSIKMLQALSLVESGAVEKYSLTPAHVAISSSSHWGDELHTDLVSRWLEQLGLNQDHLVCGAHEPIDDRVAKKLIKEGLSPCRLHNNCSGKHTGMLCTAMIMNQPVQHYELWDHFIQIRLRNILGELAEIDMDKVSWGVDGCGIPTYAMPLEGLARAFSALLIDRSFSQDRKWALKIICEAVLKEAHYIAGQGAFCTEIIRGSKGKAIVKTGAEGVYCGVSLKEGYAFALKARDGASRAAEVATAVVLRYLGGLDADDFSKLAHHTQPLIKNWEGKIVGKRFVPEHHFA